MHPLFTFVLGLLVGWLVEWLIDYFYWRRRYGGQAGISARQTTSESSVGSRSEVKLQPAVQMARDDLKIIKGIGTVIERKLNDAGIFTFEQLGELTAADLRGILGEVIERLANEESLLQQARDLARRK